MIQLTTEQIQNIVIDTGLVYVNYGIYGEERLLAPTRGGNTFTVEQDVRIIERDGAMGKEKGLRRVIREDAMLTVRIMDMSIDNIKLALAGSTLDGTGKIITNTQEGVIADSEYLDNITLIGEDLEGKTKVITLYNALGDNGLTWNMVDKDESVVEIQFSGHHDPTDKTAPLYEIEEIAA